MIRADKEYIIEARRHIHRRPELGFDLDETVAFVKEELTKMGIPFTEKYGKSSILAYINPEKTHFTIGIRADMDALPITEKTGLPFSSENEGKMHACGHDAHTAMLLGTAKALKEMEKDITCRVALLFQPSEEGMDSGAEMMVANGVMDEIDVIIGLHVENWLDVGKIGVCERESMASSRNVKIEFFGKTAHATLPQTGHDALAAAVECYTGIQMMLARRIDPKQKYVCSIGKLVSGTTQNVIPDYAYMLGTIRTFHMDTDRFIIDSIKKIADRAAGNFDCEAKVESALKCYVVYNDPDISKLVIRAAKAVVGEENIAEMPYKMSSEDFSHYLTKKPGVFFRLGTRNTEKGITTLPHNNDFMIDEEALVYGSSVSVQFVLDNMNGIAVTKH